VPLVKRTVDRLGAELCICHFGNLNPKKTKHEALLEAQEVQIVGDVKGKEAVIMDDLIDDPYLFIFTAEKLLQAGATKVRI
jgi:phosphoribosylpyrophosphate synthetase